MVSKKNNTRQIFDFRSQFFFTAPQKSWHSMKTHQNQANQPTSLQNWKTFLQNWKTFLQNSILAPLTPLKSPDGPQTLPTCSYHEYYRFWDFQRIPTSITWKIEVLGRGGECSVEYPGVRQNPSNCTKSYQNHQNLGFGGRWPPQSARIGFILSELGLLTSCVDSESFSALR